ncbi:elongation of very long chain fatty acids protein 6-like isoform X2 [Centruroides sculpturatus]|nr:elongation of very long chain fatty acids protein 6-like isoform X2 [Centruroides sculpturatus]
MNMVETDSNQLGLHESLNIERYFIQKLNMKWNQELWPYTIYWSCVYLIVIFSLQNYMKSRSPFRLKEPLVIWNLILAAFSICGTIRMVPGLWILIKDFGFTFSVCNISYAKIYHPVPLWIFLFVWSKVIEFGDTIFIVLRKQKLLFLHWYHHIATLIFTWYNIANEASTGYWFCTMNLFVHSFMYSYYAMKAMKLNVPRYVSMIVTTMQITQMFIGCFVTFWAALKYYQGEYCEQSSYTILLAVGLYLSYVFLFCRLFYKLYIHKDEKLGMTKKSH